MGTVKVDTREEYELYIKRGIADLAVKVMGENEVKGYLCIISAGGQHIVAGMGNAYTMKELERISRIEFGGVIPVGLIALAFSLGLLAGVVL